MNIYTTPSQEYVRPLLIPILTEKICYHHMLHLHTLDFPICSEHSLLSAASIIYDRRSFYPSYLS